MKLTTLLIGVSALLSATFVAAGPTATVEPRCSQCDEACPKDHFWYTQKKCCLKKGGPPTVRRPPTGRDCPRTYYWDDDKDACLPKSKPPSTGWIPSCESSTFPWWNPNRGCCENKSNPPPQVSPAPGHKKWKKSVHTKKSMKKDLKAREPCPSTLEYCPIAGVDGEYECVDPVQDVYACGGCPTTGKGQDCTAIPGALNVSCDFDLNSGVSSCSVHSCQDGFTFKNGTCTQALVSQ